jgi:hypothetical protein
MRRLVKRIRYPMCWMGPSDAIIFNGNRLILHVTYDKAELSGIATSTGFSATSLPETERHAHMANTNRRRHCGPDVRSELVSKLN